MRARHVGLKLISSTLASLIVRSVCGSFRYQTPPSSSVSVACLLSFGYSELLGDDTAAPLVWRTEGLGALYHPDEISAAVSLLLVQACNTAYPFP